MIKKSLAQLADEYSENIESINLQVEACRTELQRLQRLTATLPRRLYRAS